MESLTISELARQAQVNIETIRYYERQQQLPKPPRSHSGYRAFPLEAVERIRFIKQTQELGFSLKEVKDLLDLRTALGSTGRDVRERVEAKIADVEEKIKALQKIKKELAGLKASCDGTSTIGTCPILKSLDSVK